MSAAHLNRPSILLILSALITVLVTVAFTVYTANNFLFQRERITQQMEVDAQRSLAALTRNIAPLMEAYSVHEYAKLISTEMAPEDFYAILVEDKRLGTILGKDTFVTGAIRDKNGIPVEYDPENSVQRKNLESAYYHIEAPILSSSHQRIGKVSIYMTADALKKDLERVLTESITASVALALALIVILIFAIRRLFVRPLYEISNVLNRCDGDGIPLKPAPDFRYREISILSHALNRMREVTRKARDSVQFERDRLQNVISGTHVGTWEWHIQTGNAVFDERWAEIVGYTLAELEPISVDTWIGLVHPDDLALSEQALQLHFSGEAPFYECEVRMKHKEGYWVWVLDRGKVFSWGADGSPLIMYGTHQDCTERRQSEEQLTLAASVFQNVREGIVITDSRGCVIDVNDAFTTITGYSREEIVGQNPRVLKSGRQSPEFYAQMWQTILETGYWSGEIWNRRKSGETYPELLTISRVTDNTGSVHSYVALFADISALKAHEEKLEQIAHYDILTGLPNRLLLGDRLRQSIVQAKRHRHPLAIVFLDLDGFKEINDKHGHDTGDQVLIELASRIKHALREEDTLARLGGDEFVAVLPNLAGAESCLPILERILETSSQQLVVNAVPLQVSASLGVAFFLPSDEFDADQLVRQADQAMYQAKLNGKNRYHIFDAEQDRSLRNRHEEIEQLRHALNNSEFELYYQPQVELQSGNVVGVEALIRWNHPSKGLLPPGEFLPLIEDHELMVQLGDWTLEQALNQASDWLTIGIDLTISVNIAAVHLQHPEFLTRLQAALARHPNVPPENLELEIVETSALENMLQVSKVMRDCQEIGVMFSLDDFGTGYSSLSYLKHLPVRTLKIDQSFVRDMLDDPDDLAILKGVLGLAEAFNLQVIAEGMETRAHGEKLLSLGCKLAQGYGIARPMPAGEIPRWIDSKRS